MKRIALALAIAMAASAAYATTEYPVDENHDGRSDRTLELEQSDSLA
jgi:hypothetical protein